MERGKGGREGRDEVQGGEVQEYDDNSPCLSMGRGGKMGTRGRAHQNVAVITVVRQHWRIAIHKKKSAGFSTSPCVNAVSWEKTGGACVGSCPSDAGSCLRRCCTAGLSGDQLVIPPSAPTFPWAIQGNSI